MLTNIVNALDKGCADGYSGPDCMYPCPYPGYGFKCQMTCDCAETYCNVAVGCPSDSSTEIQSFPFSSTLTAGVQDVKKTRDVSEKTKEFTTGPSSLKSSDSSLNNRILYHPVGSLQRCIFDRGKMPWRPPGLM
ncbi:cell death abnormality protein 1-like isoform X2 [Ostrea edulis]|uniref:cell death abnormality protein 1-like isoform X2 n=1 Tax=Ostrea edulis TaxID=37623 RepID=UPI0024AF7329|nr:cell death abnormality protein 1-like isoform X2 [Ostrea edulis]